MSMVDDGSVTVIVTSPPYNVGKNYGCHNDLVNLNSYLKFLGKVWTECKRVLRPGGRICINIAGVNRKPYLPLHSHIALQLVDLGFLRRGEIIWDKGASVGTSTAWGSWRSPANPTLHDVHEYILVFSKDALGLKGNGRPSDITTGEFTEFTRSIWRFRTVSGKNVGHPAPFPEELPYRLIRLYSFAGDVVLDPFVGSGTTCVVVDRLNRRWIGIDIDPQYVKLAKERIRQSRKVSPFVSSKKPKTGRPPSARRSLLPVAGY
ncbi:DNA-methyltransferase [Candidatus Hakubella thermalkaliphila]|nr:site-specific DNA-methyltransferase [Candidatus Hakubella thermalkaliphila]